MAIVYLLLMELFTQSLFAANKDCPQCDAKLNTSKVGPETHLLMADLQINEMILAQKGCQALQKIYFDRDKYLQKYKELDRKSSSMPGLVPNNSIDLEVYRAFIQCQEALHLSCYPNLKAKINRTDLAKMFKQWTHNPEFRMKSPEVHCFQRAYLLSKELADKGYRSKIVLINSPSLLGMFNYKGDGSLQKTHYYQYSLPFSYGQGVGVHYVVQVQTEDYGAQSVLYLDPQFSDQPLSPHEYSELVTGQNVATLRDQETRSKMKGAQLLTQDFSPNMFETNVTESDAFKYAAGFSVSDFLKRKPYFIDACGWHALGKIKEALVEINSWDFTSANTISKADQSKNTEVLRGELHTKNIEAFRSKIQYDLDATRLHLTLFETKYKKGFLMGISNQGDIDFKDPKISSELRATYKKSATQSLNLIRENVHALESQKAQFEKVFGVK